MTIHVSANTGCNLGCTYCYEEPDREHSEADIESEYDMDEIFERLEEYHEKYPHEAPGMHGGEPLLVDIDDLRKVFKWVDERYDDESHIQTNATLLTDEHVEMFAEYNVNVGISCDGPKELNDNRKARGEMGGERTDITGAMGAKTHSALQRLIEHDEVGVGLIVVLTKQNAGTDEKLERLLDWMDYSCRHNASGHFNPAIPYEEVQTDDSLSPERLKEVYLRTYEWTKAEPYRHWGPMSDYKNNLLGLRLGNCVNTKCDVFNAESAKIIKGDGSTTGCGKTWATAGDGNAFLQGSDSPVSEFGGSEERYDMLKQTPGIHGSGPDLGGCHGCQYWNVCQGGCPSSGKDYDYRNRTIWCPAKYALYEAVEKDLRSMMPGIELVTDAPWWAPIADYVGSGNDGLDFNPFRNVSPAFNSGPTVSGSPGESNDTKSISEAVEEKLLPAGTVQLYREEKGRNLVSSGQNGIHADNSRYLSSD